MANEPFQRVSEEDNGIVTPLLGMGAGAGALYASKDRITGMKTLYHGTSKENAYKIKQEGFKSSMGGIGGAGAAVGDEDFIKNSQGHVHATSIAPYANFYANLAGDPKIKQSMTDAFTAQKEIRSEFDKGNISADVHNQRMGEINKSGAKAQLAGFVKPHSRKNSEILKVSMPFMEYDEIFQHDEDGGANKFMAGKTTSDISSQYVKGGKGQFGVKEKATMIKKNLPDYIKNNKGRFGLGVALAGLGGYGIASGVENLTD